MRNKDEKRRAEQVDKYIERETDGGGELDAQTETVIDALHQAAAETHPRAGFINELANQLREQETNMSENRRRSFRAIAGRLLLGGAAVAAVVVFALYLAGLFGAPTIEPAVSDDDLPSRPLLEAAGGQHFPGASFEVMVPLDEEVGEIPLYTAQQVPLPQSVEAARTLAERFSLENPTVYESPSERNRWIVMEASGRNISFRTDNASLEGIYYSTGPLGAGVVDGEPVTDMEAEVAAVTFLEEAGMLPDGYRIEIDPGNDAVRRVNVIPLLDGLPLMGNPNWIEIAVDPEGTVSQARINLPDLEPLGESVSVQPAEQAFDELVSGTATSVSYSFEPAPGAAGEPPRFYRPPQPQHTPGEAVTLTGWMNVLVPVNGGERRVTLYAHRGGFYYLQGSAVEEVVPSAAQDTVAVRGTVGEATGPGTWTLSVTAIEQQETALECLTGRFVGAGDAAVLESEAGERYALAYVPEDLESGTRVEVCAPDFDDEQAVEWMQIASPPTSELAAAGGGGGGSVAVETVEEVPVERTVSEDGATVSEAPAGSGSGRSESGGGVAAMPAEQPSPYQVGEIVEVTGIVEGVIYAEDGVRSPEIQVRQEEFVDGEGRFFVYPLVGDQQLLEEIAEENRLHVRVTGQVIPRPEGLPGTHAHAIVVEAFERVYPDEAIETFLGSAGLDVIDGEEIPVFTDAESGRQYALSFPVNLPDAAQQVWVAGVVSPERTIGDLPLLRVYESRSGDEVDQAESADDIRFDPAMPVIDRTEMGRPSLQGTLIVEQVELGYKYEMRPRPPVPAGEGPVGVEEPLLLEPTWFFYGQSEDGQTTFVIEVPATSADGGGRR